MNYITNQCSHASSMSTIVGLLVIVHLVSLVWHLLCTDCLFLDAQEVKKALRKVAAAAAQTNPDHSLVEVPSPCRENSGGGDGHGSSFNVSCDDTPPSSDGGGGGAPVPAPRMKRRKNDEHKNSSSKLTEKKASKTDATEKTKLDVIGEGTAVEKTASPDTHELGGTCSLTSSNASLLDGTSSDVSVSREEDTERESEMEAGVLRMFLLRCMPSVEHPTLDA